MSQSFIIHFFWIPTLLGTVLLFKPSAKVAQGLVGAFILLSFFYLYGLLVTTPDSSLGPYHFYHISPWIESYQINYELGVDGLSIPLIVLSVFCSWITLFWQYHFEKETFAQFSGLIVLLTGFLIGFFTALDLFLFYVLFEAMLIPMYLMIVFYGSSDKVYAAKKFFVFTFFGSIFLLFAIFHLGAAAQNMTLENPFSLYHLAGIELASSARFFVCLGIILSMGIKLPLWPVHSWLFHAHVQAPTSGSVILAAVLLKVGGYGMIRLLGPLGYEFLADSALILLVFGAFAIVYIGLVAIVQEDMKRLVAYSSVAHMGFVSCGLALSYLPTHQLAYAEKSLGFQGAYFQMISHGLISAALFLCVGMMYRRLKTREIKNYGGLAVKMPVFCGFFVFFSMANCGLPGTSGFIGEMLVLLAAFNYSPVLALLMGFSLILSAGFSLYLVKRIFYGKVVHNSVEQCQDLEYSEVFLLSILAAGVLLLGIYPQLLISYLP